VFGRIARGERLTRGLVHDAWQVRRSGRLVWADALHLDGAVDATLAAPAGFDGAAASAMLVYAASDAHAYLDRVREAIAASGARGGATLIGDLLLMRWLGRDPAGVRRAYTETAGRLRRASAGLPETLPRLWHI
jgi:urease accessory protein